MCLHTFYWPAQHIPQACNQWSLPVGEHDQRYFPVCVCGYQWSLGLGGRGWSVVSSWGGGCGQWSLGGRGGQWSFPGGWGEGVDNGLSLCRGVISGSFLRGCNDQRSLPLGVCFNVNPNLMTGMDFYS